MLKKIVLAAQVLNRVVISNQLLQMVKTKVTKVFHPLHQQLKC